MVTNFSKEEWHMVCRIVNLYKVMGEGIIKTTITLLIKQCNVKIENKSVLKKDLLFLIALITLSLQQANGIEFDIRGIIRVIGCY